MTSQVQIIGQPPPKTWNDYERGCLDTFGGGYRTQAEIDIFHHGMTTVFNLLRAEFPSAERCKRADLLHEACEAVKCHGGQGETDDGTSVSYLVEEAINWGERYAAT